jgi:hypothetical protein
MIRFYKKSAHHLIAAYNQMITTMRKAMENTDCGYLPVQQALQIARHDVVERGQASAEEAFEIGENIKLDINDAADLMMESAKEFDDWLTLDINAIETRVMEAFLEVADRTRVELEGIIRNTSMIPDQSVYSIGRITHAAALPDTLRCANCGMDKVISPAAIITDCEYCGHSHFIHDDTLDRDEP